MNAAELHLALHKVLVEVFEVDEARIRPQALLYEDLEIDSIDAVDLAVHLHSLTGKRLRPEDFKAARTLQDLVDAVGRVP